MLSKNDNFTPLVHLYPIIALFYYDNDTNYVSKIFTNSNTANSLKLNTNIYSIPDSSITYLVTPDGGKTYRKLSKKYSKEMICSN